MDDKRRESADRSTDREASSGRENDQRDDLTRRRELAEQRQPLTRREQQERWPIG